MICAAVFETDERVRELLREWTVEYLIRENRELNLLWFTQNVTEQKLEKYAKRISFALISLDRDAGRRAGDIEQVWADPSKANRELGWKADTPIEDVLLSAWNWQKRISGIK